MLFASLLLFLVGQLFWLRLEGGMDVDQIFQGETDVNKVLNLLLPDFINKFAND